MIKTCNIVRKFGKIPIRSSIQWIKKIKRYVNQQNEQKCYELLKFKQNESIEKSSLNALYEFYGIKTIVDFNFRKYGAIEMNLANQLSIIDSVALNYKSQNPQIAQIKQYYNSIYSQAMTIWIISDRQKLKRYLQSNTTSILLKNPWFQSNDYSYKYMKAISLCFCNKINEGMKILIEILNYNNYSLDQIQICLLSILSIVGLREDKQNNIVKSKILMRKICNNLSKITKIMEITKEDFDNIDIQYILNSWLGFKFNTPLQWNQIDLPPQYYHIMYILTENAIINKKYQQASSFIKAIPSSHSLNYFLKLTRLFDDTKYQQVIRLNQEEVKKPRKSPLWDRLYYNCLMLMKRSFQEQLKESKGNKEELNDKIQSVKELMRLNKLINNIQTQGLPNFYLFIPISYLFKDSNYLKINQKN